MNRPTRVLLVAYGGGHIPMVLPVMRALRVAQPGIELNLIALTTAYSVAKEAGERPWGYAALEHLVDAEFVAEWGHRLAPKERHPTVSEEETRAYVGINFWDLVQQFGLNEAQKLHHLRARYAYFPIHFFRRILAYFKPDAVVATISPRSEEAALQAAIEVGIPTLSMTDFYPLSSDPYFRREFFADRITVTNESMRQMLEDCGIPAHKLRITGNPAFDGLMSIQRQTTAQAWRLMLGWKEKTVVLWAGHLDDYTAIPPNPAKATDYPLQVEATLRAWVDASEDRALIVRYHPNEMHLFPVGPAHPRVFLSSRDQHVHEAILAADLVVVQMSTVGLEAAVAGKPVVAMVNSPHSLRMGFNYEKLGIAYAAEAPANLPALIEQALSGGCRAPELARTAPVAPIIANEILELAARSGADRQD